VSADAVPARTVGLVAAAADMEPLYAAALHLQALAGAGGTKPPVIARSNNQVDSRSGGCVGMAWKRSAIGAAVLVGAVAAGALIGSLTRPGPGPSGQAGSSVAASPAGAGEGLLMRAIPESPMASLPDVAGLTLREAEDAIERAGLGAGLVYLVQSSHPKWTVLSSQPPASASLHSQAKVTLIVSGGARVATPFGAGVLTCQYDQEDGDAYCQGDKLIQYEREYGGYGDAAASAEGDGS
jgi:hypothetical protein